MPKRQKNRTQKFNPLDPNQKVDAVEAFRLARDWALAHGLQWQPNFLISWSDDKWCVTSADLASGQALSIHVCSKTGAVLEHRLRVLEFQKKNVEAIDPNSKIDAIEAFRIAHEWAVANSAPWEPGFGVHWSEGKWCIATNSMAIGCNLFIDVCPQTGDIVRIFWNPE